MNRRWIASLALALAVVVPLRAQQRIATDFEIAQMTEQLRSARDFSSKIAARLNLGDARSARNEPRLARAEYEAAIELAQRERMDARASGNLTRYASATSYAALASAKVGRPAAAFELSEEALRYESSSARTWNLTATALGLIGEPRKAAAAARNAVTIAEADLRADVSLANRIDLAVYRHAYGSALQAGGEEERAIEILRQTASELDGPEFAALRREISRSEAFEVYSSARGDAASYLSLVNRVNLRLAGLYERNGRTQDAKRHYERVLQQRSDDPTALAALARLSNDEAERGRYFAAAFDANPFSKELVKQYREYLRAGGVVDADTATPGGAMRDALSALERGDRRKARAALEALAKKFPSNATVEALLEETSATPAAPVASISNEKELSEQQLDELLDVFIADSLTPHERAQLDRQEFTSLVTFSNLTKDAGTTTFERGFVGRIAVRFAAPTAFRGDFATGVPLRLTYHILGSTRDGDSDALLLEPLRLEVTP